jgi:glucan-binding YG repeat protein
MGKYNIPLDRVVRHYDASRKCCPSSMSANNWARWYEFKDRLANGQVSDGKWVYSTNANKWWYDLGDGDYAQDCWKKIENKWYLFDINGWMQIQWKSDSGKWYYLGTDGAMETGWKFVNNKWYYLSTDGAMKTGWFKDTDGFWYYLDPANGDMKTGWLKVDGKDYLTYSGGQLIVGCDLYGYHFDSNGVATKL